MTQKCAKGKEGAVYTLQVQWTTATVLHPDDLDWTLQKLAEWLAQEEGTVSVIVKEES
jgi:hypothetical protein